MTIHELARKIRNAAMDISKDRINKIYFVEYRPDFEISVTDDSGFRCILIGDTESQNTLGYARLYLENTEEDGEYHVYKHFPTVKEIEKRIRYILDQKDLKEAFGDTAEYSLRGGATPEVLKAKLSDDLQKYMEEV